MPYDRSIETRSACEATGRSAKQRRHNERRSDVNRKSYTLQADQETQNLGPHRLVRPRTQGSHPCNRGSNPLGVTIAPKDSGELLSGPLFLVSRGVLPRERCPVHREWIRVRGPARLPPTSCGS